MTRVQGEGRLVSLQESADVLLAGFQGGRSPNLSATRPAGDFYQDLEARLARRGAGPVRLPPVTR